MKKVTTKEIEGLTPQPQRGRRPKSEKLYKDLQEMKIIEVLGLLCYIWKNSEDKTWRGYIRSPKNFMGRRINEDDIFHFDFGTPLNDAIKILESVVREDNEPATHIRNRYTNEVIYSSNKPTIKEAVEEAVNEDVSLEKADLSEADLRCAELTDANLMGADLRFSDLTGANLSSANLKCANLYGARLENTEFHQARFYGEGGEIQLTKKQVPYFLKALGFIIK